MCFEKDGIERACVRTSNQCETLELKCSRVLNHHLGIAQMGAGLP